MNINACFFIGPEKLPINKIQNILISLDREIESLISQGVTDFISGGATGFEQMAAAMIIAKKEMGRRVRLIFALPCKHRERSWSSEQKSLYRSLLGEADEIIYISERYDPFCIRMQESYIAGRCSYCICVITDSEAHRAIRFASGKGIKMINIDEIS